MKPAPSDRSETAGQRRILTIALVLNALMFAVGLVAGIAAASTGLIADSHDMLADASAYTIALVAIGRSGLFKTRAAKFSGSILLVLGVGVLIDVVRRGLTGANPESTIMISVAALSLFVNATVLYLLSRYRAGEVHLRATWIFTRADVIANLGVIAAALLVRFTHFGWIDLIVGAAIGSYVTKEALEILSHARRSASATV